MDRFPTDGAFGSATPEKVKPRAAHAVPQIRQRNPGTPHAEGPHFPKEGSPTYHYHHCLLLQQSNNAILFPQFKMARSSLDGSVFIPYPLPLLHWA